MTSSSCWYAPDDGESGLRTGQACTVGCGDLELLTQQASFLSVEFVVSQNSEISAFGE